MLVCMYEKHAHPWIVSLSITDEQVGRFIAVFKEEYGDTLSIDEARAAIQSVLPLMTLLTQPRPSERDEKDQPRNPE